MLRGHNASMVPEDAAYIVLAANAYPHLLTERADLIEALKDCIHRLALDHGRPEDNYISLEGGAARALLRKIGEAE